MDLNDAWELFLSNSGQVSKEANITQLGETPNYMFQPIRLFRF